MFGSTPPEGTKRCSKCQDEQPRSAFSKQTRVKDGLQPRCKCCVKEWHATNRKMHNAQIHRRSDRIRAEHMEQLYLYLLAHPCVDCGETDPVVLEFDHLRDKVEEVSTLIHQALSWKRIQAEIDKCEVVCACCHRRRTHWRAGDVRGMWMRRQMESELPGAASRVMTSERWVRAPRTSPTPAVGSESTALVVTSDVMRRDPGPIAQFGRAAK